MNQWAKIGLDMSVGIGVKTESSHIWKWGLLVFLLLALGFLFRDGVLTIVNAWNREEYSHGYLIPLISLYLVWQRRAVLAVEPVQGSWVGSLIFAFGLFLYLLGELGTLYVLLQYGVIVAVTGLAYAWLGWRAFRHVWVAFLLLFFTVPLPSFLYNNLSSQLQLISSMIGVGVIKLFGISVYLEGNVIDLGSMKLQVVEACSGLRYLFPLATLAFIVAIFFRGVWWKRVLIFLSSVPITVLMNSFRIGVIGVLVEFWGNDQAEGFLHDFEGWVVFMAAFGVLLLEVWLLAYFSRPRLAMAEILDFSDALLSGRAQTSGPLLSHGLPAPVLAAMALLVPVLVFSSYMPNRTEVLPDREFLADFPVEVGGWSGRREAMEQKYVDALAFDDYLLADYSRSGGPVVNLYIAYYDSQRKGASVHSPRSCLPGGGWRIESLSQKTIEREGTGGRALRVNRVVMSMGEQRSLVYYWFQQRGRNMTNEYLVKWYLFWDAVTRNRTDGALVRVTTPIPTLLGLEEADQAMEDFARSIAPDLPRFIPD